VAESQPRTEGEGLSLQTLVVAAVASAVAALVVSQVWKGGTVLAAAMTPVIVSIVKEALQRPMQSEVVRRSATSARRVVAGTAASRTESAQRRSPAVGTVPTPPQNGTAGEVTQGDVLLTHPRRTYGGGGGGGRRLSLRGRPLKLAIVTGLLAFVVALVVITVPELVFGGAVSSGHRTTFFGGHSTSKKKNDEQKTNTQEQQQTQPSQTTPQSTTPQATPTQPQQTPSQPQAQPAPPSGGSTTPAPSAPAPSPSP
jgi:hypothetical protein